MFETPSEAQARLQKLLQEQSDTHARQHRDTRNAVAETWTDLQRVLSAHRSEQYRHFYRVEHDLSEVTGLLREHLALRDARIAALEHQLQQAQELVAQQQALLAQLLGSEQSPAFAAVSDFTTRPSEGQPEINEAVPEVDEASFSLPVRTDPHIRADARPPIKLPAFDTSIGSIAQLVLDSGAASRHPAAPEKQKEPTIRIEADELAAGHAVLAEKRSKGGGFKLPRLRKVS